MPRSQLLSSSLHHFILNSCTFSYKFAIWNYPPLVSFRLVLIISVHYYQFDNPFVQQPQIFFNIVPVLCQNNLSLRMFDNVLTSFLVVCRVYSHWNTLGHQRSVKCHKPFRGIKTDNIDRWVFFHVIGQESFGKFDALLVILPIVDGHLGSNIRTHTPFTFVDRAIRSAKVSHFYLNC